MVKVCLDRIQGLADDPIVGTDAVNANFVDDKSWKSSVRAMADTDKVLSPANVSVDGLTITEGQRVLLTNQTTSTENGIYELSSGDFIRSNDAKLGESASGAFIYVQEGTSYGDKLFHCLDELNFGQAITFTQFDASGVVCDTTSADNSVPKFDGTTGKIIQDSGVIIDDTDNITGITDLTATGTITGNSFTDGTIVITGGGISFLSDPVADSDAATKGYVDTYIQGIKYKDPVRLSPVGNINLTGLQTIDGVFTVTADRILLKDQTLAYQNGIWLANASAWSRSADMAEGTGVNSVSVFVEEGNVNSGSSYICNTAAGSDTVGNNAGTTGDPLSFVKFAGSAEIIAGTALTKVGNTFNVNIDDTTIEVFSDTLRIKDGGVSSAKLATDSITDIKILNSTITNSKLLNSSITITAGDGLQNGGAVSLGGSVALSVNSTILRTSGNQSMSGVQTITNTVDSSNITSGSLIISGGVGVGKNIYAGGDIISLGSLSADTISDGVASMTGGILSGLLDPVGDTDAANKLYVDSLVSGLKFKDPVIAATTANITLSGLQVVDAVSLIAGNRVLVKDQTNGIQNGIYEVATGAWNYATDYTGSAQGIATLVTNGSVNIDASFVVNGVDPYTIGTSVINFSKFASGGSISAGSGINVSGKTVSVAVDNTTIEIITNKLQVKNNSINSNKLALDSVTTTSILDGNITTNKLATNSVTGVKITDATVTNAKLQNSSITITAGDGLQSGGAVSLGSSVTLDVDNTVIRNSGIQSMSGVLNLTNTTASTDYVNGALVVSGGIGVSGNVYTNSNIISNATIYADTFSDGTLSITSGNISGISSFSANTLNAVSVTDGTATLSGGVLSGLSNPVSDSQAATKGYVDTVAQGIKWKDPVHYASIGINDNFALTGEQTMDGSAALDGDRVLLKDQNFPRQNGIWIVRVGAWERSNDMPTGSGASASSILVTSGTVNSGGGFVCQNEAGADTVGNDLGTTGDDLFFVQFSGAGSLNAGTAMSKTGNTFDVNVDDVTIGVSGDNLILKTNAVSTIKIQDNAITTAKITNGSVTNTKLQYSSVSVIAGDGLQNGGTVSLGGNTTLNLNSTVLRTTGDQTITGIRTINNATQSTNTTTGALVVSGGAGITKNMYVGGNLNTIGSITGGSLTDGTATLTGGDYTGLLTIGTGSLDATGTITGGTLTDGVLSMTSGSIIDVSNITSNATITGVNITDGTATLSSGKLTGLTAPSADSDAVNKAYVDSVSQGIQWKDPVKVMTDQQTTLSGTQTIDGETLTTNDRVLLIGQTDEKENGVYDYNSAGAWSRSSDMINTTDCKNFAFLVQAGGVFIGSGYTVTGVDPYIVGSDDIIFTQFSAGGSINAGTALNKTGSTLNVETDNTTIEVVTNKLQVKDGSITSGKLANDVISTAKIINSSVTNVKLANSSVAVSAGDGLQNGGVVSLGGSTSLAVDSTVLRTTGSQSMSGAQTITNATNSTSFNTGALIVSGGIGVAKDIQTTGKIQTNGTVQGVTVTDGTMTTTSGAITGAQSISSVNITASDTIQGVSITDGVASLNAGSFVGVVNMTASGIITISPIPNNRVLFTTNSGQITSSSGLTWDGTNLGATAVSTQNVSRPNAANQSGLWNTGTGNIDIGLQATGTIQMGQGPMFKLTSTTSVLQSALTIQGNISRKYTTTPITTAGNVTYTAQQVFNGIILRDCNGAPRTDILPTAEALVNIVPEPVAGSSIGLTIRNSSTTLSLLTLQGNTGLVLNETLTVASGITSRFLIVFDNIIFGQWQATVYASAPKDRVIVQCSFTSPANGSNSTRFAQFGPVTNNTVVDCTVLGYSGKIVQLVCIYATNSPIGIAVGDSLGFSLGTANETLTTFTPLAGGTDVVVWGNALDGTYPVTSSGALSIPVTATSKLAVRSVETGAVSPISFEVRCSVTIQLD